MTTDLVRLRTFLHAAEQMSFTEAARLLHLTQPTVSHHIKGLEQELEVALFDRSGARLRLTDAGRILLPWARKIVRQYIKMQEMMASLEEDTVGHLRIACSTTAGKYLLPQLAARFKERYPGVEVAIQSCTSEDIVSRVLEGDAELGVMSYEARQQGLESQEFFTDAIALIVPADHPWTRRAVIEPADLLEEKVIIRESTSGTRRVMLSELTKHGLTLDDLDVFLELGNAEAIVMTVADGFGVSFVSRLAAACSRSRGEVVEVPVAGLQLRRQIYMVRRTLETPIPSQEVFWGFIHHPANYDLLLLPEAD